MSTHRSYSYIYLPGYVKKQQVHINLSKEQKWKATLILTLSVPAAVAAENLRLLPTMFSSPKLPEVVEEEEAAHSDSSVMLRLLVSGLQQKNPLINSIKKFFLLCSMRYKFQSSWF